MSAETDELVVCIDTFENDDISGCFPADELPVDDCSTGVINELGGCEPVGVIPLDLQEPEPAVRGPQTTVEPGPDPCIIDGVSHPDGEYVLDYRDVPDGSTEFGLFGCALPVVETGVALPPPSTPTMLPATGAAEVGLGLFVATALVLAGQGLRRVAAR